MPTLIVRLLGLYLLVTCSYTLFQLQKIQGFSRGSGHANAMLAETTVYLALGLFAGLAATIWAGLLARVLTFDAEPRANRSDVSERFLGR